MAYCLPAVAYERAEVRQFVGDAAVLVPSGDTRQFADEVEVLLADPDRRVPMGMMARGRVTRMWDWRPQSVEYVDVFDRLSDYALGIPGGAKELARSSMPMSEDHVTGRTYIDLKDPAELAHYLRDRGTVRPGRATA